MFLAWGNEVKVLESCTSYAMIRVITELCGVYCTMTAGLCWNCGRWLQLSMLVIWTTGVIRLQPLVDHRICFINLLIFVYSQWKNTVVRWWNRHVQNLFLQEFFFNFKNFISDIIHFAFIRIDTVENWELMQLQFCIDCIVYLHILREAVSSCSKC